MQNFDDLLIRSTVKPEGLPTNPTEQFNAIANNIREQLKNCYEQAKKFCNEEQKHFATGRYNFPLPSHVRSR